MNELAPPLRSDLARRAEPINDTAALLLLKLHPWACEHVERRILTYAFGGTTWTVAICPLVVGTLVNGTALYVKLLLICLIAAVFAAISRTRYRPVGYWPERTPRYE